ncbi:cupin domain-containing protein, partial [Bacillus pumilus]
MTHEAGHARIIGRDAWGPELDIVLGDGSCREVIGPRSGASLRSLYAIELAEGASTISLRHRVEAVYYVIDGKASVESADAGERLTLEEGAMFHAAPGTDYRIVASSRAFLIGGP